MREEENKNPRKSKNNLFKKRWVFPAIYLLSAAIILTAVLWYQNSTTELADPTTETETEVPGTAAGNEESVPVVSNVEKFSMPVVDPNSIEIQKHFYDDEASEEEQEAALVFYNNTYTGNTGIDIVSKNGESFDVVASLSGTVTAVKKDPLLGYLVELDHGNGVTTMYSALENVKVEEGSNVEQGELLATAGRSLYNEEAGVHAHFEIRKDNEPVNPLDFFEKNLTALQEMKEAAADTEKNQEEVESSEDATDEETEEDAADEESPEEGEEDAEGDTADTPDASIGQAKA
ncbi:M23 family metallopeptidase [Bacillus pinisoli]|uniref:M23 family metallopeptidase n=1 Tax=Bacillus pinisoli TaxID=2901866 RepID=UPI001FF6B33E|nr:M23 family metallopeptidase [Bacillus pinisoli]